jgi:hypothetical protein
MIARAKAANTAGFIASLLKGHQAYPAAGEEVYYNYPKP